ncbi:hypothetical protein HPP92_000204 [Vanilla planifolia]|uniref:Uncharacterized protein n=1 Tax=Vanilla planifolia TaxID=51239 RepID=A0A835S0V1_VANPL|nr:hypothetical protein HPP92_000204 [Vanilla planifolia]
MHLLFSSRRRRHSFIRHRRYRRRGGVFVPRREEFGGRRIIDISPLESEEGLGQFMRLPRSMKDGDIAYFSEMVLPAHGGSQVDSPTLVFNRYFESGFNEDTLDLEVINVSLRTGTMAKAGRDEDFLEALKLAKLRSIGEGLNDESILYDSTVPT